MPPRRLPRPPVSHPLPRALAVPAAVAATAATALPGPGSLAALLPFESWGVLGLAIAALAGAIAWAAALAASTARWTVVDAALAGSAIATLLAPPPIAGLSPLLPLLALASLLAKPPAARAANDNAAPVATSWRALVGKSGAGSFPWEPAPRIPTPWSG